MAEPLSKLPPICKGCGRFLRTAEEQLRSYCLRCPAPAVDTPGPQDEHFCCKSDPPCPTCPYVIGWQDRPGNI